MNRATPGTSLAIINCPSGTSLKKIPRPDPTAGSYEPVTVDDFEPGQNGRRQAELEWLAFRLMCHIRWPDGPVCPRCHGKEHRWLRTKWRFRCLSKEGCRYEYSPTSGTVLHDHKMPLMQLLRLLRYISDPAIAISARTIARLLRANEKKILIFYNKVREAIARDRSSIRLAGQVEIDGVFFTRSRRKSNFRRFPRPWPKRLPALCVLTLSQRNGPVVPVHATGETKAAVREAVRRHVSKGTSVYTDGSRAYTFLNAHLPVKSVRHCEQYADGDVAVNNCESFHSRLRKAQRGVFIRFASSLSFILYIHEQAWKHSTCKMHPDDRLADLISIVLRQPPSALFHRYWQIRRRQLPAIGSQS